MTATAVPTAGRGDDRPAPTQVGSYVLVRRIGSGGTADVWLGRHAVSGGIAAVKLLAPRHAGRAGVAALFQREARLVARMSHPQERM